MATTVGDEHNLQELVLGLLSLEHDAIAAYDTAIERLEDGEIKGQITAFREDHASHISDLNQMAASLRLETPDEGGFKKVLTSGKVLVGDLFGDKAILEAMKSNEDDTVTAYERAKENVHADKRSREMFSEALEDEHRHRAWMAEQVKAL